MGVRMVVLTILFSSVATLIITVVQLFSDYRQQVEDLERRLDEVRVLLPSFAAGVWTFNDRQIQLGLKALVDLPDIEAASIVTVTRDSLWSLGTPSSPAVERVYALDYDANGSRRPLGTLTVQASLDSIYLRVAKRALVQVGSNAIKTFLVAGFMLLLFRKLVTERLVRLEGRMENLAPQMNLPSLDGDRPIRKDGDEIDRLDDGFIAMADRLSRAVRRLVQAESDLRQANADLNQRVSERTRDLEAANHCLSEAKRRAEAAAEGEHRMRLELRNFLGMVSHEFRLPLAIIGASGQLLSLQGELGQDSREEVGKIHRAVGRLTALLDVCLTDERLDAGEMILHAQPTDMAALIGDLCRDFASAMPGRISFCGGDAPLVVVADGALLRIAVSNLLDNAIKYSPSDKPVTVSLDRRGTGLSIRVQDHGVGISPDDKDLIFHKYFRSTLVNGVRGAGLGLYIVKRIIDLHQAAIVVDSELGGGTAVTIHLPHAEGCVTGA
ncbi:Osmosensitive K+ channel histidine kinase KdpD [Paramagnetospirillum magnetotacticum MS-1]|uniref:histidine kinase n=1 Tax=Paramagnetospirillum magnetotacticum MS-1 TaxID=272627 RepID=A0A0C2YXU8_PARME|nr:ATP-binding protein [Paramagnetospirillum magnetotacticum]KIL99510.1 Osmosensitive K+ channel histidine kinase KdpD [Paramagnetospirillum magnetotacticum MS-1]